MNWRDLEGWKKGAIGIIIVLLILAVFSSIKFWRVLSPVSLPEIEDLDGKLVYYRQASELSSDYAHISKTEDEKWNRTIDVWTYYEIQERLRILKNQKDLDKGVFWYVPAKIKYFDVEEELSRYKNAFEIASIELILKDDPFLDERDTKHLDGIYRYNRDLYKEFRILSLLYSGQVFPEDFWVGGVPKRENYLKDGTHFLSDFKRERVWVGIYNTSMPGVYNFIGEYCTDEFSVSTGNYWTEAKKIQPTAQSMRVRWYYSAFDEDGAVHDIIWELRKNETNEWFTFGEFTEPDPKAGNYEIVSSLITDIPVLDYCFEGDEVKWGNRICGECVAFDSYGEQHYVEQYLGADNR
jgi:hypothetical protein